MTDFVPIDREVCPSCSRPTQGYYDKRAEHMAAAFRSGLPVWKIAQAYYVSGPWAMKLIQDRLGEEAVKEIQAAYWQNTEEEEYAEPVDDRSGDEGSPTD